MSSFDRDKKPRFSMKLSNQVAMSGTKVRLTCTVFGYPEPQVHWIKDGRKLNFFGPRHYCKMENGIAILELTNAAPEDSGIYCCVAENIHGRVINGGSVWIYPMDVDSSLLPTVRSIRGIYTN